MRRKKGVDGRRWVEDEETERGKTEGGRGAGWSRTELLQCQLHRDARLGGAFFFFFLVPFLFPFLSLKPASQPAAGYLAAESHRR